MNRYLFLSLFCGLMGSTAYSTGDVIRDKNYHPTVQDALSGVSDWSAPVTLTFASTQNHIDGVDAQHNPVLVLGTAGTTQEVGVTTLPAGASTLTLTGNYVNVGAGNRRLTTIEAASPSAAPFPFLRLGSNLALPHSSPKCNTC